MRQREVVTVHPFEGLKIRPSIHPLRTAVVIFDTAAAAATAAAISPPPRLFALLSFVPSPRPELVSFASLSRSTLAKTMFRNLSAPDGAVKLEVPAAVEDVLTHC